MEPACHSHLCLVMIAMMVSYFQIYTLHSTPLHDSLENGDDNNLSYSSHVSKLSNHHEFFWQIKWVRVTTFKVLLTHKGDMPQQYHSLHQDSLWEPESEWCQAEHQAFQWMRWSSGNATHQLQHSCRLMTLSHENSLLDLYKHGVAVEEPQSCQGLV